MHRMNRVITSIIAVTLCIACLFPHPVALDAVASAAKSNNPGKLEITVLALPQGGDCTIISYGDCQILVDSGENTTDNWSLIKQSICERLPETDSVWDYLIFTHPDNDHIGNAANIFNYLAFNEDSDYSVGMIIDYDFDGDSSNFFTGTAKNYRKDRDSFCDSTQCSYFSAAGLSESKLKQDFSLGPNCTLSVLYNYYDNLSNHTQSTNNISVCFLIEYFDQKILFTGDLEQSGEKQLMTFHKSDLRNVTFFKAGHHGSNTSNKKEFIDLIRPCYVAITSEAKARLSDDELNNFLRFTDYIFPSYVDYQGSDYQLFGTTTYVFDNESVEVLTEDNSSAKTIRDAFITVNGKNVNWFKEKVGDNNSKLFDTLSVYALDEGNVSYSNCTLIKYGHVDILIDCGSTVSSSTEFVELLKQYVVDGTLEFVIVTHYHTANISQLIGSKSMGVFDQFKVETLIDSSVSNLPTNTVNGFYSRYLDITSSSSSIDTSIRLNAKEKRELVIIPNILSISVLSGSKKASGDEDDCSMSVMIIFREKKLLFVGDLSDYSDLSKKMVISNVCYFRASNSAISYSDEDLRTSYIDALKDMKPQYTVIGSAVGYRMPNGALFGSDRYKAFLLNSCSNVYCTGEINVKNEYCPINGHLLFSIRYKPLSTEYEMQSIQGESIREATKLR